MRVTIHHIICHLIHINETPQTRQDLLLGTHVFRGLPLSSFKPTCNTCYFAPSEGAISNSNTSTVLRGWIERSDKKGRELTYKLTPAGLAAALEMEKHLGI